MKTRARTDTRGPGRHGRRRHGPVRRPESRPSAAAHSRAAALFAPVEPGDDRLPDPFSGAPPEPPPRPPAAPPADPPADWPPGPPTEPPPGPPADPPPGPPADAAAGPTADRPAPVRQPLAWLRDRCGGIEPRTIAAVCVVLLVALGFAVHHYVTGRPEDISAERSAPAASVTEAEPSPAAGAPAHPPPGAPTGSAGGERQPLVIDIAGEVAEPGVRTLPPGSRVADAIEAAGGAVPGTDTEGINRARVLTDGEHLVVGGEQPAGGAPAPGGGPAGAAGVSSGGVTADGRVRLNLATAQELEQLPGVGPVLAANIAAYREQHGPFSSVEQLLSVSGIGPVRLADLRDRVVL